MKRTILTFVLILSAGAATLAAISISSETTVITSYKADYSLEEVDQKVVMQFARRWAFIAGGELAADLSTSDITQAGIRGGLMRYISKDISLEGILGTIATYRNQESTDSRMLMELALNADRAWWYFSLRDRVEGDQETVSQKLSATWSLFLDNTWGINTKGIIHIEPDAGVSPSLRIDGYISPFAAHRRLDLGAGTEVDLFAKTVAEGDGHGVESIVLGYLQYSPHYGRGVRLTAERHFGERNAGLWKAELFLDLPL